MEDKFALRAADWDNPMKIDMTTRFANELRLSISMKKEWKALEIGAGTGLVGLDILPSISKVVFEDTSAAMLDVLRSKLNGKHNAEILHGEVTDYKSNDIDFVFSCMAFHHIPDTDGTLRHLYQITRPGAVVAIGDIVTEDGSFHHFEPIPHKGFDTEKLAMQFENAGFKVKRSYIYNVLKRERIPGKIGEYEQFILIAERM